MKNINKIQIPEIRVLPYRVDSAEMNMATDRYLLGVPGTCLRLYGWSQPTLSFGRMTKGVDEIDLDYCREAGIRMVKRISGGKTVLHQHELTYAFISDNDLFPDSIVDTYRAISRILMDGFEQFGLKTEMSAEKNGGSNSSICFQETSAYELTVGSRKLVGSAQYRKRKRFFQHGSILLDIDWAAWKRVWKLPRHSRALEERITSIYNELNRHVAALDLASALIDSFGRYFGAKMVEIELDGKALEEIRALSLKYVWQPPAL